MSYYSILGLEKEPFSTSPDPYFFYHAASHQSALKRLEISLRLRRGLNLIMGDVGIGKTTLSRALYQELSNDKEFHFHLILDPTYESEFQFLQDLAKRFQIKEMLKSSLDYKEAIENHLLINERQDKKIIVLLIDEGQKLTRNNLEILRTLLNYETNEYKLLQIVILSQLEFLPRIKKIKNFFDRINLKYILNPLDKIETHKLVEFRLK
ncbi:MAG: AAA family ATPase [Cyanobacteriota bacterium]